MSHRLRASSLRAAARGETSRLSPQAPLSLRSGSRPARPFGPVSGRCRDFLKQYGGKGQPPLHPYISGIRSVRPFPPAVARHLIACSHRCPIPAVGTSRLVAMTARFSIPPKTANRSAVPATRIIGVRPPIAIASSDDSQQHWRLGHGGWPFLEEWQDRLLVYQ